MGRGRKPLGMQKGNLTVEQQTEKQQQEEAVTVGREQLSKPPSWLNDKLAKAEFKRIMKEFETINVVGNLDLNNIAGYCNSYADYRRITKELIGKPFTIEKKMPNGATTIVENPLIKIQRNYAEEMRKFAALCGLTIDSRLKVGAVKTSQTNIEIANEFGDC